MADLWTTVAAERGALADDLADLDEGQWATQSLCKGWTVEDCLAHLSASADMGPRQFLTAMARSGFSFDRVTNAGIKAHRGASPAQTLAEFRRHQDSRKAPPGPKVTWLGETIVHGEDIRRPLGIRHDYPGDAVRELLDFYKRSNMLIGSKSRIEGIQLRATDSDWVHGSGPVVEGPQLSLLMAMTGRSAALDDLQGDGLETLRRRM